MKANGVHNNLKFKNLRLSLFILCAWMIPGSVAAGCAASANFVSSNSSCSSDNGGCAQGRNTWLPRSFSSYSMRDINQRQSVNDDNDQKINFTFITEFMQNFGKCAKGCKNLGSAPFWSGTNTLTIGQGDGRAQLDAYQLGMGNVAVNDDGIGGVIQLDPKIQHVGTDMMMLYQHSKDDRGFYFKIHAPLGAMIVNPRLTELTVAVPDDSISFKQTTTGGSDITYEFPFYPVPALRPQTVSEAFYGGILDNNMMHGNLDRPIRLRKGRIAASKQAEIRMADVSVTLGYNVFMDEKGFVGVGFKATCPTGNVPKADYMLEPIFGRAGAWGVGGELSAAYKVWENDCGTRYFNILAQGEVLHLLPGRNFNYRSFDLKMNGPGSKYMLIQEYRPTYSSLTASPAAATQVYVPYLIQPAVNMTTLPVISKIAVEGSFALQFDFHCDDWNVAVGGEFWGRSHERLAIDTVTALDIRHPNLNNYAVLGRQVSSYRVDQQSTVLAPAIAANLCQPNATISKSEPAAQLVGTTPTLTAPTAPFPDNIADATIASNRIPELLSDALDIAGAQAGRAFTGKVTGQIGYTWSQHVHAPSIMVMGGAEFTNKTNNAVQLWSVAVQGSVNF